MTKYMFKGDPKLEKSLVDAGILIPAIELNDQPQAPTKRPIEFLYAGTFKRDNINVSYTAYRNAVSVSVFEEHSRKRSKDAHNKTLYAQNFYEFRDTAINVVEGVLRGLEDVDDLIFKLKELKEEEIKVHG